MEQNKIKLTQNQDTVLSAITRMITDGKHPQDADLILNFGSTETVMQAVKELVDLKLIKFDQNMNGYTICVDTFCRFPNK